MKTFICTNDDQTKTTWLHTMIHLACSSSCPVTTSSTTICSLIGVYDCENSDDNSDCLLKYKLVLISALC